jgi:hypothetical protein
MASGARINVQLPGPAINGVAPALRGGAMSISGGMTMVGHAGTRPAMKVWIGLAAVALLGATACSKGAPERSPGASSSSESTSGGDRASVPNSTVRKTGSGTVEALFGPPGGTLELSSGPRVEIPPGAVEDGQEFVLKEAPKTTAFFNSEHEKPVGPPFIFSPGVDAPEGRTIQVSIPLGSYPEGWGEVSIAYEYPVGAMVGAEDAEHTKWQYEDAKLSGGRAVAQLPALNGYRLQFVLTNLEAQ